MSERLIAIQIGAVSFVDEGTEQVLDILQEQAGITCLFLAACGRALADLDRRGSGPPGE